MHISRFCIRNYKAFLNPAPSDVGPGLTVVVGQNNSGKTALLEALSLLFEHKPHRQAADRGAQRSEVEVDFTLTKADLLTALARKSRQIYAPMPSNEHVDPMQAAVAPFQEPDPVTLTAWVRDGGTLARAQCRGVDAGDSGGEIQCVEMGLVGRAENMQVQTKSRGALLENRYWPFVAASELIGHTTLVRANTVAPGRAKFGNAQDLSPDCSNLPQVLLRLQRDPGAMAELNDALRQILPTLGKVSVQPLDDGEVEVLVWPGGTEAADVERAVPLADCGAGVGQVLSVLYPLLTAKESRAILVDEPQCFLHPGALRKLMELLHRNRERHQFVISTNSPGLVSASEGASILTTLVSEGRAEVSAMSMEDVEALRGLLRELGVRPSDVFGADRVLWVEGPTERECFAEILREVGDRPLLGIAIVPVRAVDDLTGKNAELVFDLYERFTDTPAILPPAVAFIFDRENRTVDQCAELQRRGRSKVRFLDRRMYENYLLDAEAVGAFCNSEPGFGFEVSPEDVRQWFTDKGRDVKYDAGDSADDAAWRTSVRADKVLEDLIAELSEARCSYRKVEHGRRITRWLLEHRPEALEEIRSLLKGAVGSK